MPRSPLPFFRLDRRAVLAGLAGVAVAGCVDDQATVDDQGRVRLRLGLDGPADAEHGGFYQAVTSGAYARRGLAVELIPGGPVQDLAQSLASGAIEIGLASGSAQPLALVAQGAPVRSVAAFFQRSPDVLIARSDTPLVVPDDLRDRPFLMDEDAAATTWPWLVARHGLSPDQARIGAHGLDQLEATPDAVLIGRWTRQGAAVPADDETYRILPLANQDWPAYGGLLVAPNGFARDNASALRAFIAASAEGWRDWLRGDARPALARIAADNPALPAAVLTKGRRVTVDQGLVDAGDAVLYGFGAMTADRWSRIGDSLRGAPLLPVVPDPQRVFTPAYLPGRT